MEHKIINTASINFIFFCYDLILIQSNLKISMKYAINNLILCTLSLKFELNTFNIHYSNVITNYHFSLTDYLY